jgi:hypothetical protein
VADAKQCDQCGKFAPHQIDLGSDYWQIPEGWIFAKYLTREDLAAAYGRNARPSGEFCSWDCVAEYTRNMADAQPLPLPGASRGQSAA